MLSVHVAAMTDWHDMNNDMDNEGRIKDLVHDPVVADAYPAESSPCIAAHLGGRGA